MTTFTERFNFKNGVASITGEDIHTTIMHLLHAKMRDMIWCFRGHDIGPDLFQAISDDLNNYLMELFGGHLAETEYGRRLLEEKDMKLIVSVNQGILSGIDIDANEDLKSALAWMLTVREWK